MRREDLEHILRALATVADRRAFLVIGSQSILGTFTEHELPLEATMSTEVDIAPITRLDRSKLDAALREELDAWYPETVDADVDEQSLSDRLEVIGEWSQFHETFDVYVQGVGTETAVLPEGWEKRLVVLANVQTGYTAGLCLDPADLCAAKLVAGREHDYTFVHALITNGNVDGHLVRERTLSLPPDHPRTPFAQGMSALWASGASSSSAGAAVEDVSPDGPLSPPSPAADRGLEGG